MGLLALSAGTGRAETPPPDPYGEAAPPPPVAPDTTGGARFLDRINFHPSYSSSYSVNRTTRVWTNDLAFVRKIGFLDFSHSLSLKNNQDKAQNGLRGKSGTMKNSLDYKTDGWGGWTVALDSNTLRSSQFSSFRDQVDNNLGVGMTGETDVFNSAMHSLFPALANFSLSAGGNGGYSVERSASRRSNTLDSTRVGGIYNGQSASFGGTVRSIRMQSNFSTDRRLGDSRTLQYTRTLNQPWQVGREEKDTSDNRSRKLNTNVDWTPFKSLKGNAQAHRFHEINQYWDPLARDPLDPTVTGAAESKDGRDDGASAMMDWTPSTDSNVHTELNFSDVRADFQVQPRDFRKRSYDGKFDGKTKLPAFLGPLGTTEIRTIYQGSNTRNILQETGNYRQVQKGLRNEVRRSLFTKVTLSAVNEITLYQYFYDDHKNDRDEMRNMLDGILMYNPSMTWSGMFNVSWTERQTVNIPGEKSANNNTSKSYRVSGQVDWRRGLLQVSQKYTIQADYTFYDFNENNNNLVRSNEVLTTFLDKFAHDLTIGLLHQYQFRDVGKYVRQTAGAPWTFNPTTRETRHVMTLNTSYPIGKVMTIEAKQTLDRRRSRAMAAAARNRVTTTTRGEFSLKANVQQDFSDKFKVSASFQKTESLTERNYWTVQAQVQRIF